MITSPVFPVKLPGELWGITTYYNPAGYKNRLKNYRLFTQRIRAQGLRLIAVEAAFGDAPFVLEDNSADIVVRVRTKSILWQKERLINLARRYLPKQCDKVAWLDADGIFLDPDWIKEASESLERYVAVQPYHRLQHGPEDYVPSEDLRSIDTTFGVEIGQSASCSCLTHESDAVRTISGYPGYAMAVRRNVIDECGLYEAMILGGGDSLFFGACHGIRFADNNFIASQEGPIREYSTPWVEHVFSLVKGSMSYTSNEIVHLWHGDRNNRFYAERKTLLRNFDPLRDTRAEEGGCLEWTTAADPSLKRDVELYFSVRNEDGNSDSNSDVIALREKLVSARP